MLKFFRRIRKGLLVSGKIKSYSFYAIGEIVLVVIGILIALQINNWNEWRKDREKEVAILENVAKNLEFNSQILEKEINRIEWLDQSGDLVFACLQEIQTELDKKR